MRYFDEKERKEIEEIVLQYIANQNSIPAVSEKYNLTDVMQEMDKHGINNPSYFSLPVHRKIFKIFLKMKKLEKPINMDSFYEFLFRMQMPFDEKTEIMNVFVSLINTKYYSLIYFEYYIYVFKEHILMDYWNHIFKKHQEKSWKTIDVIDNSFGIINGFQKIWDSFTVNVSKESNDSLKQELIDRVEKNEKGISTSIKTDLAEWDDFTGGFEEGELYLIAGRPSMGKTTVAISFIKRMIFRGKKVHFFTLEMTRKQIINKFVADDLGLTYQQIKRGDLSTEELQKVLDQYDLYENHPYLVVDELPTQTISEFKMKLDSTQADIRIVDYLQLLRLDKNSSMKAQNREQEVGEISKALKRYAKGLKNPMIALSQLSRAVELRSNKRPQLSDLRESGSLEQDADVIVFVYRDAYYQMQNGIAVDYRHQGNVELIIAKGREIGLRTFEMWLDLAGNKIEEGFKY